MSNRPATDFLKWLTVAGQINCTSDPAATASFFIGGDPVTRKDLERWALQWLTCTGQIATRELLDRLVEGALLIVEREGSFPRVKSGVRDG